MAMIWKVAQHANKLKVRPYAVHNADMLQSRYNVIVISSCIAHTDLSAKVAACLVYKLVPQPRHGVWSRRL